MLYSSLSEASMTIDGSVVVVDVVGGNVVKSGTLTTVLLSKGRSSNSEVGSGLSPLFE